MDCGLQFSFLGKRKVAEKDFVVPYFSRFIFVPLQHNKTSITENL